MTSGHKTPILDPLKHDEERIHGSGVKPVSMNQSRASYVNIEFEPEAQ